MVKIGDRVSVSSSFYINGGNGLHITGRVERITELSVAVRTDGHYDWLFGCSEVNTPGLFIPRKEGGWWPIKNVTVIEETHFPLYSEEAAVKLLEERGYAVTPPPEPLKGKVVIYRNSNSQVWTQEKTRWDAWPLATRSSCTILAIVDWTEGDGL